MNNHNNTNNHNRRNLISAWLSLATSGGTLICCALPALFVALGAGAVLAGLVRSMPSITLFSEYKVTLFIMAALMLTLSGGLQWHNRHATCPIGSTPQQAHDCERLRQFSQRIWLGSVSIYTIGVLFAFILPALNA